MHQDHSIPWSQIAAHFKATQKEENRQARRDNRVPPKIVWIDLRGGPRWKSDLTYFISRVCVSIETFAATERAKIPAKLPPVPRDADLFSPALRAQYQAFAEKSGDPSRMYAYYAQIPGWLHPNHQYPPLPERWRAAPALHEERNVEVQSETFKALLGGEQEDFERLLALAQHRTDEVSVARAVRLGQARATGWETVAEAALEMYVTLNLMAEVPSLRRDRRYTRFYGFAHAADLALDWDSQRYAHWPFWWPLRARYGLPFAGSYLGMNFDVDPFQDTVALKQYLRRLFELLYRCEMLAQECKCPLPNWPHLLQRCLNQWGVPDSIWPWDAEPDRGPPRPERYQCLRECY